MSKFRSKYHIGNPKGKRIRQENEEEDNKSKIMVIIVLLFLCFFSLVFTTTSIFFPTIGDKVEKLWVNTTKRDTPTAPVISGGSKDWAKQRIIRVVENAHSYYGIDYYEYCITKEKNSKNCTFYRTDTKNTVVSKTGKYYIYFRGVSKKGTKGSLSNREVAYIDNNNPELKKLLVEEVKEDSAKVRIFAKDQESGIKGYYYKLDNGNWTETTEIVELKELKENTKYTLEVKVEDKVGNFTIGKVEIQTVSKESSKEEENKDTDKKEEDSNKDDQAETDQLKAPTYKVSPSTDKWTSYKVVEIIYPAGVEKEYSLDSGKTWKKYTGPITFTKEGTIIGRSKKGKLVNAAEELKIDFIDPEMPKIDLNEVPGEFTYGESYKLPSHVTFGESGGSYSCTVESKEHKNTSTIGLGPHKIVCIATGNNGLEATVEKDIEIVIKSGKEETWGGWITMNLYYPENSTNWMWRLGDPNEIRDGSNNSDWQEYTGPITIKLTDVENVYIKYTIDGKEVIIPPAGKLMVSIEPSAFKVAENKSSKIAIIYDGKAETKEYKINNGPWKNYTGPFEVQANTKVEAKATYLENIYDKYGNLLDKRTIMGNDSVYIGKMTEEEDTTKKIKGPNIIPSTKEPAEKVKLTLTTELAAKKLYIKIGNTEYQEYEKPITIDENQIIGAYYITKDNVVSQKSYYNVTNIKKPEKPYITFKTDVPIYPNSTKVKEINVQITGENYETLEYSYDGRTWIPYVSELKITENKMIYAKGTNRVGSTIEKLLITNIGENKEESIEPILEGPNIIPSTKKTTESVNITITTMEAAKKIYIKIGDEEYQEYTNPLTITKNTLIQAYYISQNGNKTSEVSYYRIQNIKAPNKPLVQIQATPTPYPNSPLTDKVIVEIIGEDCNTLEYSLDGDNYQSYQNQIEFIENGIIYARGTNKVGQTVEQLIINNIGEEQEETKPGKPSYYLAGPIITPSTIEQAETVDIAITTAEKARKIYVKIGNQSYKEYKEPLTISDNVLISAYYIRAEDGQISATSYYRLENIYIKGLPYVYIDALPYPYPNSEKTSQTIVNITGRNYDQLEYSIDGYRYSSYTETCVLLSHKNS